MFHLGSIHAYEGTMCYPMKEVLSRVKETAFPENRLHIVPGFIQETIKDKNLPAKVSLAYIDFDLYEPILITLRYLAAHMPMGGVIIVDDYGFFSAGVEKAVDCFFEEYQNHFKVTVPPKWSSRFIILTKIH